MSNEPWRMSAAEAVDRLKKGEISPLELVEVSARRIADVEPAVNALPTLCLDRARDHAKRIMEGGAACEAAGEAVVSQRLLQPVADHPGGDAGVAGAAGSAGAVLDRAVRTLSALGEGAGRDFG